MAASDDKKDGGGGGDAPKFPKMSYRQLGNTGLLVSVFGFGTMSLNNPDQSVELLRAARDIGINFFDNAELYGEPCGNAEILFGNALKVLEKEDSFKWRRTDLVITTKIFFGPNAKMTSNEWGAMKHCGVNEFGVSRKRIREGLKNSLKRMNLDYVDVVYAHRYDALTPVLEVVKAFTEEIRAGRASYWGTSMWPPTKLVEAYWLADKYGLEPPIVEQPAFSMFKRENIEKIYMPLFSKPYNLATTTWSPLYGGVLTGKYLKGIPKDSRMGDDRLAKWFKQRFEGEKAKLMPKVAKLKELADELKVPLVQLVLAWTVKHPNVTVVLLGASRASQLHQNAGALKVASEVLTADVSKKIEAILDNKVGPNTDLWMSRAFHNNLDSAL